MVRVGVCEAQQIVIYRGICDRLLFRREADRKFVRKSAIDSLCDGSLCTTKPLSFSLILRFGLLSSVSSLRSTDRHESAGDRREWLSRIPVPPSPYRSHRQRTRADPEYRERGRHADFRIGGARRDAAFDDPPRDPNSMQLARILSSVPWRARSLRKCVTL